MLQNIQEILITLKKHSTKHQLTFWDKYKIQKFLAPIQNTTTGQCSSCCNRQSLCYRKFLTPKTLRSIQAGVTCNIFYQITSKSSYAVCLLECIICKMRYVEKSEAQFNISLNITERTKNSNTFEACKHFNSDKHTFSKHGKSIFVEQLRNIKTAPTNILLFSVLDSS